MIALIQKMETVKDGGMGGPTAEVLVGGAETAAATTSLTTLPHGGVGSGEGFALELFNVRRDPCEATNLLLLDDGSVGGGGGGSTAASAWLNASATHRAVLRTLRRGLARAASRAALALHALGRANHPKRPFPRLRHWFCFQPFKASALDWPVIHRHHTCLQRSQHEHYGNGSFADPLRGRSSRARRSMRKALARSGSVPS